MTRLDIRWRLTLWYGLMLGGLVALFAGLVLHLMRGHLLDRTDMELDEELAELVFEVQTAPNETVLRDELLRRFDTHHGFEFQLTDADGRLVFRSRELGAHELQRPPAEAFDAEERIAHSQSLGPLGEYRVATRMIAGPESTGRLLVQAAFPLEPNRVVLHALSTTMLVVAGCLLLAALLTGYWLARRALAPVEQMAATASRITATRLGERLPIANPDDELGRLAATFNAMLERLQKSTDELRRFTADAAHELRTPLAVLRTETEVALRTERSPEEYRRVIENALRETGRLSRLADRLLLLARYDSGLLHSPREEVPLDALVQDVVEQFETAAGERHVQIVVQRLEPCLVWGDDLQLSQVVFNLVENALKFTPAGGRVAVALERRNGDVWLSVSDTGIGIPPEELPHVCKRFYRADKSRQRATGGAGLGLAICAAILQGHAGELRLESDVGRGTRADVRLPAAPGEA